MAQSAKAPWVESIWSDSEVVDACPLFAETQGVYCPSAKVISEQNYSGVSYCTRIHESIFYLGSIIMVIQYILLVIHVRKKGSHYLKNITQHRTDMPNHLPH